jgi:ubiquitin carboxyl-terminal hydrolase 25
VNQYVLDILYLSIDNYELIFDRLFYSTLRRVYPNKELVDEIVVDNRFIINIQDRPVDIREGLDITFGREDVEGVGKRYQTLVKAAPFIQIYFQNQQHIKTVKPDGTIESTYELVDHPVKVPATINMGRYMDNPSPALLHMRQVSWDLRENRKALRAEQSQLLATDIKGVEGPDALDATYQFVNSLGEEFGDTSAITEILQEKADQCRSKIEQTAIQIKEIDGKLTDLPLDKFNPPDMDYTLFAVFIHRGNAYGGHYWVYIRDIINNKWRKYEDSTVSIVDNIDNIMNGKVLAKDGRPNLVVYVNNDQKDVLTQALHRVKPEFTEGEDIEMTDAMQPQTESQKSEFTVMEVDGNDATQLYHG